MELSKEDLQKLLASRTLTSEQEKAVRQVLSIETNDTLVKIPDGFQFLRDLKKEAKRQESMKNAEQLEVQARDINRVPQETPSIREEVLLAESFEIIIEE